MDIFYDVIDELSEEDQLAVYRARKLQKFLTQPLFSAEFASGVSGAYVSLKKSIEGCHAIVSGECDMIAEDKLYMIGELQRDSYA